MEGSRRHHLGGRSKAREHGATSARRERGAGRPAAAAGWGAIWRYLALSGYLILSHSISCRSDKRIGQTRASARVPASSARVAADACGPSREARREVARGPPNPSPEVSCRDSGMGWNSYLSFELAASRFK